MDEKKHNIGHTGTSDRVGGATKAKKKKKSFFKRHKIAIIITSVIVLALSSYTAYMFIFYPNQTKRFINRNLTAIFGKSIAQSVMKVTTGSSGTVSSTTSGGSTTNGSDGAPKPQKAKASFGSLLAPSGSGVGSSAAGGSAKASLGGGGSKASLGTALQKVAGNQAGGQTDQTKGTANTEKATRPDTSSDLEIKNEKVNGEETTVVKMNRKNFMAPHLVVPIDLTTITNPTYVVHFQLFIPAGYTDTVALFGLILSAEPIVITMDSTHHLGLAHNLFRRPTYGTGLFSTLKDNKWEDIYLYVNSAQKQNTLYINSREVLTENWVGMTVPISDIIMGTVWLYGPENFSSVTGIKYANLEIGDENLLP